VIDDADHGGVDGRDLEADGGEGGEAILHQQDAIADAGADAIHSNDRQAAVGAVEVQRLDQE
jgi:hypothetical protein